ncbi:hypothetical protein ACEPAI_4249 [Sanghuangporus weigelae]
MSAPVISEGTIPFIVGGETYSTWYKLFGSPESTTRPLVVLHGGPGASHDYMLPLADLAQSDRPVTVILYNQLGTARSKYPDLLKKDPSFWTIELFISELENLPTFFNISYSFDLIGHSWGATLAAELISPPTEVIFSLSQAELEGGKVQKGIRDNGMANDWSIIDRIHEIRVPTLLINGKDDFMSDEVCMPYFLVRWCSLWFCMCMCLPNPMYDVLN